MLLDTDQSLLTVLRMKRWLAIAILAACGGPNGNNMPHDGSDSQNGSDTSIGPDLSLGCRANPPAGAKQAAAPKPYAGTCPTLPMTTTQDAVIMSSGHVRKFWVVVPQNLVSSERLPVMFLWHWLRASPQDFYDTGQVQAAVDQQRFLAVIPEATGGSSNPLFTWPATTIDSAARLAEEAVFFDDMLSCV